MLQTCVDEYPVGWKERTDQVAPARTADTVASLLLGRISGQHSRPPDTQ